MPVAVKWQMLLLSQKEALWLFNLILLFYGCFLCINPQEQSFVFVGIRDGPQLPWASQLPPPDWREQKSWELLEVWDFFASLKEHGGGTEAEGTLQAPVTSLPGC